MPHEHYVRGELIDPKCKCSEEEYFTRMRAEVTNDFETLDNLDRALKQSSRGRYEMTKLALMEACWKHENTDIAEKELDRAVEDWTDTNYSWAYKVGYGIAVLLVLGLATFAFAFAAWGIRTFVERFS